ncbi:hypothetical protein BDV29DRAFT_180658 [Aspergillus leporis]|uniref:Uncharacterized protein n=1 Tax=Aspergillus leporis TaxID=41062 RepID=A0A5N5WS70_9EURO|nr:hypothetical protein BDV29DRAFT_180658 [Aspergillus leporis]
MRPISDSSISTLNTYADEIVGDILVYALIEWPASYTADLVELLSHIKNYKQHF